MSQIIEIDATVVGDMNRAMFALIEDKKALTATLAEAIRLLEWARDMERMESLSGTAFMVEVNDFLACNR